jgi:SH3-like domain-containing protein
VRRAAARVKLLRFGGVIFYRAAITDFWSTLMRLAPFALATLIFSAPALMAAPMGSGLDQEMINDAPVAALPGGEAQQQPQPVLSSSTGLPIPRYASMGASQVNMRSGPGEQYPISWVYKREALPVEITGEFGPWRKVKDMDGIEGWVNGNLLSDQRTGLVLGQTRLLYSSNDSSSRPLYRIEKGVVAKIIVCDEGWCQLNADGKTGFILREHIWGTYANENFN